MNVRWPTEKAYFHGFIVEQVLKLEKVTGLLLATS